MFSINFQNKILRYKIWSDAQLSILGRIMLFDIVKNKFNIIVNDNDIEFIKNNKPVFKDIKIHFNISHSLHISTCVVTKNGRIGVDIEKIGDNKFEDFAFCFTDKEKDKICESAEKSHLIVDIWTKKESLIKLLGEGLMIPLNKIETECGNDNLVIYNSQIFNIKKIHIANDYCCYICSEFPITNIYLKEFVPDIKN
ncbi:MAG: 4'-phosphopantetheinyl transferase family protein [Chryseobacterium gambrini]